MAKLCPFPGYCVVRLEFRLEFIGVAKIEKSDTTHVQGPNFDGGFK